MDQTDSICYQEINLKRYYDTIHATKFTRLQGQLCKDILNLLKKSLKSLQSVFKKLREDALSHVKTSYLLLKKKKKKKTAKSIENIF